MQDGVDYIPMPTWKIFMIQFLNIAGLGPIFGAIMGAKFGTASFLWIVLGSIFAGATHDFLAGALSLRYGGESLPELIGRYLGKNFMQFMRGFTVILMCLVGAVFVAGPAGLLASLTPESLDTTFWIIVVFAYYVLATLLPIDKIIGKVYPLFAIALLFMVVGILVMLFVHWPALPEITDGLKNTHPSGLPIFPIMFVSIACGAISGFHATQSPLMARCMKNERYAYPVFYGAMIVEGIVALIWAAAATYFFHENGMGESNAAVVVDSITKEWLGTVGGLLAILGVIAAPITSPGEGEERIASQQVWFPAGDVWYDFFTHERVDGGQVRRIAKPLYEFPLYVRGGWVLPMQPYTPRPASTPLTTLVMRVYPASGDADNTYTLYEDDGLTRDYERGLYATTELNYRRQGEVTTITIRPASGSYEGQVPQRAYRLQLPAMGEIRRVKVNGRAAWISFVTQLECPTVEVPATDIRKEIRIEIFG